MMLKRTADVIECIRTGLNETEMGQEITQMIVDAVKEKGLGADVLEEAKVRLVLMIYYKMALDHDDIKEMLAKDLWEMYRAES